MFIRATVVDGIVIPDEPLDVPNGTKVFVEVTQRDWLLRFAGIWREQESLAQSVLESFSSRTASSGREL